MERTIDRTPGAGGPPLTRVRLSALGLFVLPLDQEEDVKGDREGGPGPRQGPAAAGRSRGRAVRRKGSGGRWEEPRQRRCPERGSGAGMEPARSRARRALRGSRAGGAAPLDRG